MLNFDFSNRTRLVFGKGAQSQVGEGIRPYARKVLLHYGSGSIKRSGLYDQVVNSLSEAGIEWVELGGVAPNPRLSLVHEGVEICRRENVELILAVGGGSAIDSAKAIAIGVYYDGDVWDFYGTGKPVEKALPVATVLTIPAAGSEASTGSVITNEKTSQKMACNSLFSRPVVSFVNPELFFTLPKNQIANGVSDMMSHIFERYFTNTTHTDLTDALCEATLKTIMKNAPTVYADPSSYDAWCQVGFGGTVAHNDLLGVGRAQDWGCHDMEHELSAIYDVAHGAGLAVLTPAWMTYVHKENPGMFVQFAVNVMGVEGDFRDQEALILEGIDRLRRFYKRLGLPLTMKELGIDKTHFELMAKKASGEAYGSEHGVGGLKRLYWQDIKAIYELADY
jgi:alcohol dehydrogenase YqhD (iron-dependent ADH family)